jgi:hypothetical protein
VKTAYHKLRERARRRHARVERQRRDPRYREVLGRLVGAGLLTTNEEVPARRGPIRVADALWAGALEPRILEMLPALLIKKPALFVNAADVPNDLAEVVRGLRRGGPVAAFRGIPVDSLSRWLPRVGHRNKLPTRSMTFRLKPDDVRLLEGLHEDLGISRTEILRRALRVLAAQTYFEDGASAEQTG